MAGGRPTGLALFTDLYQLTMLEAYFAEGLTDSAVFTLFVRRLPEQRNVLIASGIESVLAYLEQLQFSADDIAYLRSLGMFSPDFLTALGELRFTGDVDAVPEGTPVFANEPVLEVVAPIMQAQVVETFVMNQIHVETVLASKAIRVVTAAQGRRVVDFGARRTHGLDAALKAARASYVAGVDATSNVLAGKLYGIPVAGTMAHSYIQAHVSERDAFRAFARRFPGTVLLVDTYDTLTGVRRVIDLVKSAPEDVKVGAVRLDSGDLVALARETRRLLDEAGLHHIQIFVSSGLDEHSIAALLRAGAPIDGFGVGTGMTVSADAPSLDIVYKLAEYGGAGRTKLSLHKSILPGRKQIFRREADGTAVGDVIGRANEGLPGRPLLHPVMRGGQRVGDGATDLGSARGRAAEEFSRLPPRIRDITPADPPYPVGISAALERHFEHVQNLAQGGPEGPPLRRRS
jgi:nicotinate phosphoribosyltransferase